MCALWVISAVIKIKEAHENAHYATYNIIFCTIRLRRLLQNIFNNCASDRYRMIYLTLITGVFYTTKNRNYTCVGCVTLLCFLFLLRAVYFILSSQLDLPRRRENISNWFHFGVSKSTRFGIFIPISQKL